MRNRSAPMVSRERVLELLRYEPRTGRFFWRSYRGPSARAGDEAGGRCSYGHVQIKIDGRLYLAHRLAWLVMTGGWPSKEVDHINRVRDDNRWANLREATRAENAQNRAIQSNNSSGYPGVSWHAAAGKWFARIGAGGTRTPLGFFDCPHEAFAAYSEAKAELHSFHPEVPL